MNNMEWKPVVGYEGLYVVSSTGIIKSLDRDIPYKRSKTITAKKKGIELSQSRNSRGYLNVALYKDRARRTHSSHKVVIVAFKGVSSLLVNHIDSNKLNNNIENLEYVNAYENMTHYAMSKKKTSKYNGVHYCKLKKRWIAQCSIKGKQRQLGAFKTENEAFNSYRKFIKLIGIENKYLQK